MEQGCWVINHTDALNANTTLKQLVKIKYRKKHSATENKEWVLAASVERC